ncbi:hypothetical protein GCM10010310_80630 [Streptomyces violaceolatus]|uniref:Uncharacterized protein n=1 Tax=Streptomyces violaceolatus TaxID=67378 RepID=A0ABN3TJ85_9ACTN
MNRAGMKQCGKKEKPAAEESPATDFQNTWFFALVGFANLSGGNRAGGIGVTQLAFDVGLQA